MSAVVRHPRLGAFVGVLCVVIVLAVAGGAVFLVTRPVPAPAGVFSPAAAESEVRDLTALAPDAGSAAATPAPVATPTPAAAVTGGPGITPTPPGLLVISQVTLPEQTKDDIARLRNVHKLDSFDGGAVRISGVRLNLLAVDPARFRAWAPKAVAAQPALWAALDRGELVADSSTARRFGLVLGGAYQVDGGPRLRVAASAAFGLPGVDGLVGIETGRRLGLLPGVALLVNGPEGAMATLNSRVRGLLGSGAQVVTVKRGRTGKTATGKTATGENGAGEDGAGSAAKEATDTAAGRDTANRGRPPAVRRATVGRPGSYLELYRRAAGVCPGLSWTVLAAIGQVESSHGRNNGPSSAGAQGPMQFMPATWKAYGVDGDGDGVADIWNPYDAVPGAANYLCANGAGQGGRKLEKAIWFYNHSWSYVAKVMALSQAYARAYP